MECWNQADMDVSGGILRPWMPAIHAGMMSSLFSCFVDECKIMNHSVVDTSRQETQNSQK
jgi:hypothetical protein